MRPIDTSKALRELRAVAKQHGLEVEVYAGKGQPYHYALNFEDPKSGERVHLVLPRRSAIAPGVQREAIKYFTSLPSANLMAGRVLDLLVQVFQDSANEIAAVAYRSAKSAAQRGNEIEANLAKIQALRSASAS